MNSTTELIMPYIYSQSATQNSSSGTMQTNFKVTSPSINPANRLLKTYYNIFIPDQFGAAGPVYSNLTNSSNLAFGGDL